MKLLSTEPIERLSSRNFKCGCGLTHAITTSEILFRERAIEQLSDVCEKTIGKCGKIFVVYSERSEHLRETVRQQLKNFDIISKTIDKSLGSVDAFDLFANLPEDVRLIVGVGGGVLADTVKYAATALGKMSVIVPDLITTDAFLSGASVLYKNGFKEVYRVNPPNAIVADLDIITDMDEAAVAAAFGNLLAKNISLFDWKVSNILCGEKYCSHLADLMSSIHDTCFTASDGARRRERTALATLSELNLRSGLYMQLAGNSRLSCGGETHVTHALEMLFRAEERELKRYGENVMLSAAFVIKVYRLALSRDFGKILPAPDNNLRSECMELFLDAPSETAVSKVRPLISEGLLLARRHRLEEFKEELLAEVQEIEARMEKGYKLFKRLYLDAGLGLSDYLDSSDFRIALPLAPDIREKFTLLTMLKDMGLLDAYLPNLA